MIFGIVVVERLYVRPFAPNRDGRPSEVILTRGDRVDIIEAVYGEEIEGINVWYVQKDQTFVWSGGVTVEETILVPDKRVIFTADDYGVIDSIDAGVHKALVEGCLSAVACLTNFGTGGKDSLGRIRSLDDLHAQHSFEIGVHLTITSGNPVLGRQTASELCRPEEEKPKDFPQSDFYEFTDLRRAYIKKSENHRNRFLVQLRAELEAQIEVLKNPASGSPVSVDHLSVHHNAHLYHEDFFRIFMEVAEKYNLVMPGTILGRLPLRSLHNVPEWKDSLYLKFKGKVGSFNQATKLKRLFCSDFDRLDSPGFLHSGHYGPLPIQNMYGYFQHRLIKKKRKKLWNMLNDLRWSSFRSMEFLLHLRDGEIYRRQRDYYDKETKPVGYAGIDFRAFDTRTAELRSFLEAIPDTSFLPKGVIAGTWQKLKHREMCV